jgi:primosomal protein N'
MFKIDGDSVKTHKKGVEITENFFSSPGSILLGTEMVIPYIYKDIDNSAVVGIDSLFTIPDFRMSEKIFNILLSIRIKTLKNFLIQTRNTDEEVFEYIIKGNLLDFYRTEIKQRKEFGYPPVSTLIKITYRGKKPTAKKEMGKLSQILEKYKPSVYPTFTPGARGTYGINALIKIEKDKWIDKELLEILRSVPPSFTIKVDPGDLL